MDTRHYSWLESFKAFIHPNVIIMLFFGFSAGLPLYLIFSSLSVWLTQAGIERATVTFFSWAALGYSFKFIWAPLVDLLPLPLLTRCLGRRRGWLLFSQVMVIGAIILMAMVTPNDQTIELMALAAILLGFSSATQDIVIDAYRIESAEADMQAMMASMYVAGYRVGNLVSGAGVLYLSGFFGSTKDIYLYSAWQSSYLIMAMMMGVGVLTTLLISEPSNRNKPSHQYSASEYGRFLLLFVMSAIAFVLCFYFTSTLSSELKNGLTELVQNRIFSGVIIESFRLIVALGVALLIAKLLIGSQLVNGEMIRQGYIDPVKDFFSRYSSSKVALLLLAVIGLYRVSDIVLGVIANVFYLDLGFSSSEIATVSKAFGFGMTLLGGFVGGVFSLRFGVIKILFLGALLSAVTNLLFMLLANAGYDMPLFYAVVAADNLSAGIATAAFIAFLSSLTNISFTATQYAIFSSLMTLIPKILGGYSGSMVDTLGYSNFFLLTTLMGVPVLILIALAYKHFEFDKVPLK